MTTDGGQVVTFTWGNPASGFTPAPTFHDALVTSFVVESSTAPAPTPSSSTEALPVPSSASSAPLSLVVEPAGEFGSSMEGSISNEYASSHQDFGGNTAPNYAPDVQYIGNVGKPYGSNMLYISEESIKKYPWTNTFNNNGKDAITVRVWNKAWCDNSDCTHTVTPLGGQGGIPNLLFKLPPGQSKTVAFAKNTEMAWSQDCPLSSQDGATECTWGEATFGKPELDGSDWSSYDVSTQNAGNCIQFMSISGGWRDASISHAFVNAEYGKNFKNYPVVDSNGNTYNLITTMNSNTLPAEPQQDYDPGYE